MHVDLLVVEYAGGDKLFLPVYRLNQIEKYAGGDTTPKVDSPGWADLRQDQGSSRNAACARWADELLKLYAERAALKKDPLNAPDDEVPRFRSQLSVRGDTRPSNGHRRSAERHPE